MNRYVASLAASLLAFSTPAFAQEVAAPLSTAEVADLSKKADKVIDAMLDEDAGEYRKVRVSKRVMSKELGERSIVVFTIEGFSEARNSYQFYVGLFGKSEDRFRFLDVVKIGAKGWRHVDFTSAMLTKRVLEFDTQEYESDDALCCPSRKAKARYAIENDHFVEVKPSVGGTKQMPNPAVQGTLRDKAAQRP